MARTRKDNSSPMFRTFCEYYDEYAYTHKLLMMVELAGRIYYGYILIDLNWLLTYCYLGTASNGLPKLRIKPTNRQKAALINMMDDMHSMTLEEYERRSAPYVTHISAKDGTVKANNRGVRFEAWAVETIYGQTWTYNTDAHIYHTDVANVEIKTGYDGSMMTYETLASLMNN